MKRLTVIILTITLILTLTACGEGDSGSPPTPDTATPPQDATDTPAPTPTPEATPADGNGNGNGGDSDPNAVTTGNGYFPDIDDALLPDDVLKFTVGTLESAEYSAGPFQHMSQIGSIKLIFVEVTEVEFDTLEDHYKSAASEHGDMRTYSDSKMVTHTFNFGSIQCVYYPDESKVEVSVQIMGE